MGEVREWKCFNSKWKILHGLLILWSGSISSNKFQLKEIAICFHGNCSNEPSPLVPGLRTT